MSRFKRRQFLQFAGSTLAALGMNQLDFQRQSLRHGQVLAQSTSRKLALLVGINDYVDAPLQGCINDVEMQKQLLIHRFGFKSQDIRVLADAQATRQGMLEAFEQHLIQQAKPGDVVVFHFSGHGSQVADPDCDFSDCRNSTFVPADSSLAGDSTVADIMGHTLFLLVSALKTENVTVVLDSCHSGGGTRAPQIRGNLQVRSLNRGSEAKIHPVEAEYQQRWLSELKLSDEEFKKRRRTGVARGVAIASTQRDQLAADAPFNDFFAGAFSYLMTQYLWQQTGDTRFVTTIPSIARSTMRMSFTSQEPLFETAPGQQHDRQPMYFVEQPTPPAEAVILNVQGNTAKLWLGGLDPQSLAAFGPGAVLSVVDENGDEKGLVELVSRDGLQGQGKMRGTSPTQGALLQERVRGIPSDLSLRIGLDPSLGSETAAASQGLRSQTRIQPVPLNDNSLQAEVQYIFGRMTAETRQRFQQEGIRELPEKDSLGLFSPSLEIVPDSFGQPEETAIAAIQRLQSKLKSLLAARVVKLTLNSSASRLNITATMNRANSNQLIANSFTPRGIGKKPEATPKPRPASGSANRLPIGTKVELAIRNQEARDLYLSALVIDPTGEMAVIFPNQWTSSDDVTRVKAGATLRIPGSTDNFSLVTQAPKGVSEVLIVASTSPLRQALQALRQVASRGSQSRGPVAPGDPTNVIDDLLGDLDASTTRGLSVVSNAPGVRSVDTSQIAALSITFEVI